MRYFARIARWIAVTVGIVLLTSVTIDATRDGGSLTQSALGILARSATEKSLECAEGMVRLGGDFSRVCVDRYEVSPSSDCPHRDVQNPVHTTANTNRNNCFPVSVSGAQPWTFVTLAQAQALCGRAGKRLLSNAEWYRASLGTLDGAQCNVNSSASHKTGEQELCVSGVGVYDMIGNVWEWVDGSIQDGMYNGRVIPGSGYVAVVDGDGVALSTQDTPEPSLQSDYFWSESGGVYGMLRGGFYGSRDDAGVYSIQGKTSLSFSGAAVGFRCADDLL